MRGRKEGKEEDISWREQGKEAAKDDMGIEFVIYQKCWKCPRWQTQQWQQRKVAGPKMSPPHSMSAPTPDRSAHFSVAKASRGIR
jgi:hypothetical protein